LVPRFESSTELLRNEHVERIYLPGEAGDTVLERDGIPLPQDVLAAPLPRSWT